jgi:hypothetical protein
MPSSDAASGGPDMDLDHEQLTNELRENAGVSGVSPLPQKPKQLPSAAWHRGT